ncbi:MAG: hypothetical protein Q9167_006811 [Letrouitia subvulpina]
MEETNYHRTSLSGNVMKMNTAETSSPADDSVSNDLNAEKEMESGRVSSKQVDGLQSPSESGTKSYTQKLKLFEKDAFNYPNRMASLILSKSPYGFSSSMVGLSYLSPLIGVAVAALYTGTFGDWFIVKMARRNRGIMEPEHRLWLFSISLVLLPGGLILWGVGAAHGVHWFGIIFAMGVIGCTNTLAVQISASYCIDSYRELSGEAIVTVILIRNTMSFAVSYG